MILATGAAVAGNIPELVRKTKYVYELIGIEEIEKALRTRLAPLTQGVWAVSDGGEPIDLELPSVLMLERSGENLFRHGRRIYATGIVTDKLFQLLRTQQREVELIIRDFTRVFASPEAFYAFLRGGTGSGWYTAAGCWPSRSIRRLRRGWCSTPDSCAKRCRRRCRYRFTT